MPKSNVEDYLLEGQGATIENAEISLGNQKTGLIKKLEGAKASTELSIARLHYIATYTLKEGREKKGVTKVEIESVDGWEPINEESKRKIKLSDYDAHFSVKQWVSLSEKQRDAALGRGGGSAYETQEYRSSFTPPFVT